MTIGGETLGDYLSDNKPRLLLQKEGGECDGRYSSQVLRTYRFVILLSKILMDVNGLVEFSLRSSEILMVWILLEKYNSRGLATRIFSIILGQKVVSVSAGS